MTEHATSSTLRLYHYAVVKCACGYEPDDAMENDEACQALMHHLEDHDAD